MGYELDNDDVDYDAIAEEQAAFEEMRQEFGQNYDYEDDE